MATTVTERGLADIIHSEGKRNKAYRDSVGVWTIGVGHTALTGRPPFPRQGMTISDAEIMKVLREDIKAFETIVHKELGTDLPAHVHDGSTSFVLNTGGYSKNGKPASWMGLYKAGKMKEAEKAFMQWNKPKEILGRRRREADLIFRGIYYSKPVKPITGIPVAGVGDTSPPKPTTGNLEEGSEGSAVKDLQEELRKRNYTPGIVDGKWGKMTTAAVLAWRSDNKLSTAKACMTLEDMELLRKSPVKPVSEERANMPTKEIKKESSTANMASLARNIGIGTAALPAASEAAKQTGLLDQAEGYAQTAERTGSIFKRFTGVITDVMSNGISFVSEHKFIIMLVGVGVVAYIAHRVLKRRVEQYRAGIVP